MRWLVVVMAYDGRERERERERVTDIRERVREREREKRDQICNVHVTAKSVLIVAYMTMHGYITTEGMILFYVITHCNIGRIPQIITLGKREQRIRLPRT